MILRDGIDGLPLIVAVDGKVWLYDPIGRQILLIRAEPEFQFVAREDKAVMRWGIRADFPNAESRDTLSLDIASMMASLVKQWPNGLSLDREKRTATFKYRTNEAVLRVTEKDASRPESFFFGVGAAPRFAMIRLDSFAFGDPLPDWHRPIDQAALAKDVRVVAVADAKSLPAEVQGRLENVNGLLRDGGLFIIRPALRNAELREAIEKNSPLKLDFDAIKRNDEQLQEPWRKALEAQGLTLPKMPVAKMPATTENR